MVLLLFLNPRLRMFVIARVFLPGGAIVQIHDTKYPYPIRIDVNKVTEKKLQKKWNLVIQYCIFLAWPGARNNVGPISASKFRQPRD